MYEIQDQALLPPLINKSLIVIPWIYMSSTISTTEWTRSHKIDEPGTKYDTN